MASTPITVEYIGISWRSHYASGGLSLCLALPCIAELSRVTPGEHTDEDPYLQQARLRLRSGHSDAAHSDRPDASGTGSLPRDLQGGSAGLGGGPQLSQSRAPQTLHCTQCRA